MGISSEYLEQTFQPPTFNSFNMADDAGSVERTFICLKPDAVQRGLIGEIIGRFEKKGFQLVGMKFIQVSKEFAAEHYADLSSKGFLTAFATSSRRARSAPWCGRVWVWSPPAARCSAPPTRPTRRRVPSAATLPSTWAATSATAPTRLSRPTTRLSTGSSRRSWLAG